MGLQFLGLGVRDRDHEEESREVKRGENTMGLMNHENMAMRASQLE